jgi:uncharacterized protein YukE
VSSPGFQSDAAAVARAITAFDQSAADARKTMADLEQELTSTLGNQYQGNQAVAFWQLHQKLNEDMQVASQQLNVMRELVHQAHTNYNTGDASAADALHTVTNTATAGGNVLSRLVI